MHENDRLALSELGTSLIGDALERLDAINGLTRYDGWGGCMVGPALTVKTREGDNLAILRAIELAQPGDVLLVDGAGSLCRGIVGDLARAFAMSRGIVGFLIEGAIRDVAVFRTAEPFSCFARGVSPNGPFKDGPGRINVPIAIGGQVVLPGDIVVADDDGVVSFASSRVREVITTGRERLAGEIAIRAQIGSGAAEQPWLTALMATSGTKIS